MLRLRSDEQLVASFRAGDEDAFRVIHDRYRQRLFAYTRQMLPSRQDAEEALQDVFLRAYAGLRSSNRDLALRAWLYRVAHNRCVDELRRPAPPPPEVISLVRAPLQDPIALAEDRESLRRLIADVRRLPEQQRSALLMRELTGMSYSELAGALGLSVAAVKSLLVRARVSLAHSLRAQETACGEIREELVLAHDHGRRPAAMARRHLRDCAPCRQFRSEIRGVSKQLAALAPGLGPMGVLANMLGLGGGGGAAGGAAAGGGTCAGGMVAGSAGHVATLLAAAAVTAGGAVEIQHTFAPSPRPNQAPHVVTHPAAAAALGPALEPVGASPGSAAASAVNGVTAAVGGSAAGSAASSTAGTPAGVSSPNLVPQTARGQLSGPDPGSVPITAAGLDPGMGPGPMSSSDGGGTASAGAGTTASPPAAGDSTTAGTSQTGSSSSSPSADATGTTSGSVTSQVVSAIGGDSSSSPSSGVGSSGPSDGGTSTASAAQVTGSGH